MTMLVRQVCSPEETKQFDTSELRKNYLIENLFQTDKINMTYSHLDRTIVGGVSPVNTPVKLVSHKPVGSDPFLTRREMGVINIGSPGTIEVDGIQHNLGPLECLYIGKETKDVSFASTATDSPAKFYFISLPAHHKYETRKLSMQDANKMDLGDTENANERTIYQYIHPDTCNSCQLSMGVTLLKTGSNWNTMPCHVHDRRSEVYLYFSMEPETRVFHFMGEPEETRHLVVANEQVILSPGWSVHCGAGTSNYSFIWAMGGDNQDFTDMDMVSMETLK